MEPFLPLMAAIAKPIVAALCLTTVAMIGWYGTKDLSRRIRRAWA